MIPLNNQEVVIAFNDGTEDTVSIPESEFGIMLDGELLKPIVTRDVAYEKNPQNESLTDQCGTTEKRNLSTKNWNLTIEGIVIDADFDNNLGPPELIDVLDLGEVRVVTEWFDGSIVVDGGQFNRDSEVSRFHYNGTTYKAYQFQLQLGERGTEDDS